MRCNYIRAVGATFFQRRIHIVPMRLLRYPGVEVTDKTVKLPPHISEVLNSAPHPIGSPVKGSRQLCCRGVELKPINYQLALRCDNRSLVGNGFIRSARYGFASSFRSGYRKKCIGRSVKAPLKR